MPKYFIFLILMLLLANQAIAQQLPREGAMLNYRIIAFRADGEVPAARCDLEISDGNTNSEKAFTEHLVKTLEMPGNRKVAEVPAFGHQYTWRTVTTDGGKKNYSAFHHFSTGISAVVDTARYRLRVLKTATKYQDAYVFLDGSRALYDMSGNPVWYLPDSANSGNMVNDLKVTPQGTITCLLDDKAYEVDFNGNILWKAPDDGAVSGAKNECYNHQFSRLVNGDYLVMGSEQVYLLRHPAPGMRVDKTVADSVTKIKQDGSLVQAAPYGTLIEYDHSGKVVWCWHSLSYLKDSGILYRPVRHGALEYNLHQNAFYFDEKNKVVYLSFRVGSILLKISYPDGKVLATYGDTFLPGAPEVRNGLFSGQHAVNVGSDGDIYLFNNNVGDTLSPPSIVALKEGVKEDGKLGKTWEFVCPVPDSIQKAPSPTFFQTGGNVTELPDQSFFASMPTGDSRVFIVDRNKEMIWEAEAEKWNPEILAWTAGGQYRASIIVGRSELERIIWNQ